MEVMGISSARFSLRKQSTRLIKAGLTWWQSFYYWLSGASVTFVDDAVFETGADWIPTPLWVNQTNGWWFPGPHKVTIQSPSLLTDAPPVGVFEEAPLPEVGDEGRRRDSTQCPCLLLPGCRAPS